MAEPNHDKTRDSKGRFAPGFSGNPSGDNKGLGGRPSTDIKARFAVYDEESADGIHQLATGTAIHPAVRLAAFREILDRAHGRPKQTIVNEISEDDLNAAYARMGLATRKVLVPVLGEVEAARLMSLIVRKELDLREGEDSDGED